MPKGEGDEIDFAAMRTAYEGCTIGKDAPDAVMCNGAVLNAQLGVTTYDPDKVYFVTADSIVEVSESDVLI